MQCPFEYSGLTPCTILFVFGTLTACACIHVCVVAQQSLINFYSCIILEAKQHLTLLGRADKVKSINLTWSSQELASIPSVADVMYTFTLNISHGSSSETVSVNASHYHFTAPEDAPPCEVYNFSVTATYVCATYTGAGCSIPSPVLSTMLPSLPNISQLEPSIHYSLKKEGKEKIILILSLNLRSAIKLR